MHKEYYEYNYKCNKVKQMQDTKCPKCEILSLKLIKEGIPKYYLNKYPEGLCRKCKRELKKELRSMLK